MPTKRREFLKAGLAGSLFLPLPYAWVWAQSEGTIKLLRAPKVALVLGNSKYKEAPLKNPANDAKAIGDALRASGFDVTVKLDAGKAEMAAAVQAYVQALAAKKAVGLFYYAGHGIQLAWKNYMLPVDADVDTIGDVQKQAVEVHALMEGLTKAGNPMNVVVLDACRDNPFGSLKGVEHKGLSQMDAPNHTLLAYATSPGNVASDGDGANGLYTENLLRELKVPEAKVEDVFKRVRLGVRVKSKGAQIPWESTSLEEDFWFLPPKELKKFSDQEKAKLFKEELAIWEKAKGSNDTRLIEDYLRLYPTGSFCEIAQFELDRVLAKQGEKKIEVINAAANPYTKGSEEASTAYQVGDSYRYRELDPFSKVEQRNFTRTVSRITQEDVAFDDGFILDLLGNIKRFPDGRVVKGNQSNPLEYSVGKRWTYRPLLVYQNGTEALGEAEGAIVSRQDVVVPAGRFNAFRIDLRTYVRNPDGVPVVVNTSMWMAPVLVRAAILREETRHLRGQRVFAMRTELVSFKQG